MADENISTVEETTEAVCSIGDVTYQSISAAISSVKSGASATIKVLCDHTIVTTDHATSTDYNLGLQISSRDITLDLDGHTILFDMSATNRVYQVCIYVSGTGKLTITGNGTINYIRNTNVEDFGSYMIMGFSQTVITIENGMFNSCIDETPSDINVYYSNHDTMIYTAGGRVYIRDGVFNARDTLFNAHDNYRENYPIMVTGGTFNREPLIFYYGTGTAHEVAIPYPYIPIDNKDGTWCVVKRKPYQIFVCVDDVIKPIEMYMTNTINKIE